MRNEIGKHLTDFGLINMNGLVYDPVIGRFLSADPVVQDQTYVDGFNRYAYVLNNPLKYIDPSGYLYEDDYYGPIYSADQVLPYLDGSGGSSYSYQPAISFGYSLPSGFGIGVGPGYTGPNYEEHKKMKEEYRRRQIMKDWYETYGDEIAIVVPASFSDFFHALSKNTNSMGFSLGLEFGNGNLWITGNNHLTGQTSLWAGGIQVLVALREKTYRILLPLQGAITVAS